MLDGWTFVHPRSSFSTKYLLTVAKSKAENLVNYVKDVDVEDGVEIVWMLPFDGFWLWTDRQTNGQW